MRKILSIIVLIAIVMGVVGIVPVCAEEQWLWPVPDNKHIYQPFKPYVNASNTGHSGIDISKNAFYIVYAAKSGTVITSKPYVCNDWSAGTSHNCASATLGSLGTLGNYIEIQHSDGTISRYGHLCYGFNSSHASKTIPVVNVGDYVSQGTPLGIVGSTGSSSGQHLHFTILKNGSKINNNPTNNNIITSNNSKYSNSDICAGGTINYIATNSLYKDSSSGTVTPTPSTPPSTGCNHSYWKAYEGAHPHREYMVCSCGDYYYTGNNGCYTAYEGAHPHKYYYVCEVEDCSYHQTYTGDYNYYTAYEGLHPHKYYYVCGVTGCSKNGTYTGTNATTTANEETYPYNEYYVCPTESCSYHKTYTGNNSLPGKPVLKNMKTSYFANDDITFAWNATSNTTHYNIYVDKINGSTYDRIDTIHYATSGTVRQYEKGKYRVLLQSTNSDYWSYTDGDWFYFNVYDSSPAAPVIKVGNTNYNVGSNIKVSWDAVENATSYKYYLCEYPEGYAYTTNTKNGTITSTSINFSDLGSGKYHMFVHSVNTAGQSGQSNWISFNVYEKDYIPSKTVSYNGHIYAVYDYEMAWTFARDLAKDMGGHLVTITSSEENSFIQELIACGNKNAYWIGAYNADSTTKDFLWVTGEEFSYSDWYTNEPSMTGTKGEMERYAEIRKSYNNHWNDLKNINKTNRGFIVEIEPDNSYITATEMFNGNKYLLIDKNTTWTEAQEYCKMLGGHLVVNNSEAEQEFVSQLIQKGTRAWYYLGGIKENDEWHWIDGSSLEFMTWADNAANWNGKYLMEYKNKVGCIGLNNTYFPAQHINNIGFICEIEKANIEATVIKTISSYKIETTLQGIASRNRIIVVGYKGEAVVDIESRDYNQQSETFTLNGDIDEIKIMVWDSLSGLMPICEAEVIPKSEWIIE